MGRRTLLLIASILVAALGTALIWLYVQGAESRARQGQALVTAYFLNADQPAGAAAADVLRSAVVPKQVPADVAVPDPVTSLQQIQGQHLTYPGVPGQLLLKSMFTDNPSSGLPPNTAAVSITISDPHRVPALLKPGDRVAVYALRRVASGGASPVEVVAKSVVVATIGNSTQPGINGRPSVPVTIVGFNVPPQDAVNLLAIETYADPALVILGDKTNAATAPHL